MDRFRNVFAVLMLAAMALSSCGSKDDAADTAVPDAELVFAAAGSVYIDGDADAVKNRGDVLADGKPVGQVRESGITDPRITYSVNGEDRFYIKYYTKGDIEDERYPSGATYAYYDMNGTVLGYSQERLLFRGDDMGYMMTFLNADGTMKDYFVEANDTSTHNWAENNAVIRTMDRNDVGSVDLSLVDNTTKECSVTMSLGEAAGQLSEMDRAAVYWKCMKDLYDRYCQNE